MASDFQPPIYLEISGPPIPWASPRLTRTGIAYNPRAKDKRRAQREIRKQYAGPLLTCPIRISFVFYMPIPKSLAKRLEKLQAPIIYHQTTPDTSNLIKFNEDVLTGIVFEDDKQNWKITASKIYAIFPKTAIIVNVAE